MVTRRDLYYAAGFFDGEGSISLLKRNVRKDGKIYWILTVQVTGLSKDVLMWFHDKFSGGIYKEEHKDRRVTYYKWMALSKTAACFLSLVVPMLKIKRRQAEIGLEFQKTILPAIGSRGKMTDDIYYKRLALREEITELNRRF